ncbi:outer membrane protein [Polynucleobacter nymphae]|uniref:outer membrane protein n=1 Tax=Polynucleobacter nymphae TaxID=2081043 RepID=UPI001C0DA587|nr:outer membrane beta-barrel protein [Polynucleobacter nymphae]MBU3608526.1 outer membrane beta-barrel protein [Polynucleobacter nymphae]
MKIKLLVAVAATVLASSAMAQSAFQGFYGQLATGYESNSASNLNYTGTQSSQPNDTWNTSSQTFGGAALVLGAGYNYSVAPKWLVGVGIDYSALSQKSSAYSSSAGSTTLSGSTLQTSNRFNIFVTPGYEIDKDKLVYLKAGYSSVSIQQQTATTYKNATSSGPLVNTNSTSTQGGYVVGLGYKQIITGGIYGFAEGNYMSYGKPSFSVTQTDGYKLTSNPSLNSYQLLIGVGYKF